MHLKTETQLLVLASEYTIHQELDLSIYCHQSDSRLNLCRARTCKLVVAKISYKIVFNRYSSGVFKLNNLNSNT